MKKTAIIMALCIAALTTGCGRVDSVEVDKAITPFEIETAKEGTTDGETDESNAENFDEALVTTDISALDPALTTVQTGAVNLVKRTNIAVKTSIRPSMGTVSVPNRNTSPRPPRTSSRNVATTAAATVTTAVTTVNVPHVNPNDPTVVTNNDIICSVKTNGIDIFKNGAVIQHIEIDTSNMLNAYSNGKTDMYSQVQICDFDFDGNDDIFIPQEIGEYNTTGVFKHYNPSTGKYEDWSEMAAIGGFSQTNTNEQTIIFKTTKNDLEHETQNYKWNDAKQLIPVSCQLQYRLSDAQEEQWNVYIDYFEYPNGIETLMKREKLIFNDAYEIVGSEEIDITWTVR